MVLGATSKTLGAILGTASLPIARKYIDPRVTVPNIPIIGAQAPSRILTLGIGVVVLGMRLLDINKGNIPILNKIDDDFLEFYAVTALTNVGTEMIGQRFPLVSARVTAPIVSAASAPQVVAIPSPRVGLSVF